MKFKNYIETESGIKDTSASPGTAGQLLSSTVAGTSWIDQNTISSGSSEVVDIQVKNISSANGGVNLVKGDPVYIYGSVGASARLYVDLADADSTATNNLGDSKMPCVALLDQDLAPNIKGTATVVGKLRNLITSPIDGNVPNENDTVYVKPGGGLTLTKPTGSTNLIQNVGQVGRVSASSDGNIVVAALLRTNDVPNLPEGRLFVGTSANTSLVSDVVYVDDTNDRVGIGTAFPESQLHLEKNTSNAMLTLKSTGGGDNNSFIRFFEENNGATYSVGLNRSDAQFRIAYSTDGNSLAINPRFVIDNTGDVGIGTTNPTAKTHIEQTIANGTIAYPLKVDVMPPGSNASGDGTGISFGIGNNANNRKEQARITVKQNYYGVRPSMSFDTTDYNSPYTDFISRILIDPQGNVGVGTTNPNAKLEVAGSTRITGGGLDVGYLNNGTNFIQIGNGRSTNGYAYIDLVGDSTYSDYGLRIIRNNTGPNTSTELIHRGTGIFNLNATQAANITFRTSNIERVRINSSGNVGINTTSPTQAKLQITVPDYFTGCRITGPASGTSFGYMQFYSGTSFRGAISPTSTGVNYSSASDYRLKENVIKLQNSTERVKKLKPSNFNFLENPSKTVDGFIAHEVQEVVPEAVTGEKDAVGRDGRPEYQGVDQSKIVPLLTAALQEAISKIEQLETRIQILENK